MKVNRFFTRNVGKSLLHVTARADIINAGVWECMPCVLFNAWRVDSASLLFTTRKAVYEGKNELPPVCRYGCNADQRNKTWGLVDQLASNDVLSNTL